MNTIKFLLILLVIFLSNRLFSQKWKDGKDLRYLKGQKEILLKFNYARVKEEDVFKMKELWLAEKIKENELTQSKLNSKSDSVIKLSWIKEWEKKTSEYEAKFESNFNQATADLLQVKQSAKNAKYTLQVNVLGIYADSFSGNATCDMQILIYQSIYPAWPISEAEMLTDPGENYNAGQVALIAASVILFPLMLATKSPLLLPTPSPEHKSKRTWKYSKFSSRIRDRFAENGWDLGTEIIENR